MEKLKIDFPIIAEGKYDKIKILSVADAKVYLTDGFGVFKNEERLALIRRLAEKSKIILLTDSDGAGKLIRSHISSAIPRDRLIHLYIPQVEGKEKRKKEASAEGFLGVEGTDTAVLRTLLQPFSSGFCDCETPKEEITKVDLYLAGLTGKEDSREIRDSLAVFCGLPRGMTPNAFLTALNVLFSKQEFFDLLEKFE